MEPSTTNPRLGTFMAASPALGETRPVCQHCKKMGHDISHCFKLNKFTRQGFTQYKPALATSAMTLDVNPTLEIIEPHTNQVALSVAASDNLCNLKTFTSLGFVSQHHDSLPYPITILKDTGASKSFIVKGVLSYFDNVYTGEWVLVSGITGKAHVPRCRVHLTSDYVKGYVTLGVVETMPIASLSMLLGNDLAGELTSPDPIISCLPVEDEAREETTPFHPQIKKVELQIKKPQVQIKKTELQIKKTELQI